MANTHGGEARRRIGLPLPGYLRLGEAPRQESRYDFLPGVSLSSWMVPPIQLIAP